VIGERKETRRLGLIGGLGPSATVHYYRELIASVEKGGRVPRLLMAHANIDRVYAMLGEKDLAGLARYLASLIAETAAGGAELSAIVAATPHICAAQLVPLSPVPFIDMLSEVAAAVRTRGLKRVALLGTRFTVETHLFGSLHNIEVIAPKPDEIEMIHRIYMNVVVGRGTDAQLGDLRKLAQTFVTRDGAQSILIAGTDLSPVLTESNSDFPLLDCARIHIDAIAKRMLA
jgi:aspartate racemase